MEVSMDSTNANLPPRPQAYPTSPSAGGRKRPIEDVQHDIPSRPARNPADEPRTTALDDKENATTTSSTSTTTTSASFSPSKPPAESPAPSPAQLEVVVSTSLAESTMNTVPDSGSNMNTPSDHAASSATTPAAKKRKLSPGAKQQEKEAKERQRLEEKAKKEEEKAKREEERRAKEEEKKKREAEREEERRKKDERRRMKEEEKVAREEEKRKKEAAKEEEKRKKEAAKEEERRKKEEERLKKERAQPKLNAFFAKPKPVSQTSTASHSPRKAAGDGPLAEAGSDSRPALSDYQRLFPDFFLQSHTTVAPVNRFERDAQALQHMRDKVDALLKAGGDPAPRAGFRPSELFQMMPYQRRRGRIPASVKEILLQMQNLGDQPETSEAVQRPRNLLKQVRMKSLKFGEDVRPPYQGTYTRRLPAAEAHRLMRNPFHRGLPETNYDYESEAEWEEPEEGEELDSEEEEDVSEDGEDDLDGFLDDEGDDQQAPVPGKRRLIVGDLEPVCSGLQWQSDHPGGTPVDAELHRYRMETISDAVTFPIDPFSTTYWAAPAPVGTGSAGPGRSTLHAFLGGAASSSSSSAGTAGSAGGAEGVGPGRPKRAFPADQLEEFKRAVDGSDLSKLGLIEILKKRFPKVSKEVLKETLNSVATRVGQKEVDKKWVCQ